MCRASVAQSVSAERSHYQYVIMRRLERAKELLQGDQSLAEVTAYAGFSV
jgi:AraC-like DNA-binding protein